ncbi:MAG: YciI family protein [Alphaproteobacteria bacterium]|nr:YciI family protein [Alphaproteobacteria bacterium]
MQFVIHAVDKPDSLSLRLSVREAHFAYLQKTGAVQLGGPFLDDQGNMCGSLMIMEAEDFAALQVWLADEPYTQAGLFQSVDIRQWKPTYNPIGAKL